MSKLTPAGSDKGLETHGFSPSGADEQSWAWAVSAARSYLAFGSLCLSFTLKGNEKWHKNLENSLVVPQKVKHRVTVLGHFSRV